MTDKLLGTLEPNEFMELLDAYIEQVEPDTLSFAAFDEAVQQFAQHAATEVIEVTGVVEGDTVHFDAVDTAPIFVQDNAVQLGAVRLVFKLRRAEPA